MGNKRWFWAVVALQILLLLTMAGRHAYTLATGTPVQLKTAPVDPWDYTRGEYVRLNYEISTLSPAQVPMQGRPYEQGQTVWVTLRPGQPFWTAAGVAATRPAVAAPELAVRATVEYDTGTGYRLRYGIEQFYVPEGEGRRLEDHRATLTVEAKVDGFGRAGLSRVFLDGEEISWR